MCARCPARPPWPSWQPRRAPAGARPDGTITHDQKPPLTSSGPRGDLLHMDRRDDGQPIVGGTHMDPVTVANVYSQDHLRQRVLQLTLDHTLQRTGTVGRVVACLGQPLERAAID